MPQETAAPTVPDARAVKKEQLAVFLKDKENPPPLVAGETWYVLSSRWHEAWTRYIHSYSKTPPGPVSNADLLDQYGVKPFVQEGMQYKLVHESLWNQLKAWWDIEDPSHELPRHAVEDHGKVVIDAQRIRLKVCTKDKDYFINVSLRLSRDALHNMLRMRHGLTDEQASKLWNFHRSQFVEELEGPEPIAGLVAQQKILFELQNDDGTYPSSAQRAGVASPSHNSNSSSSSRNGDTAASHQRNSATNNSSSCSSSMQQTKGQALARGENDAPNMSMSVGPSPAMQPAPSSSAASTINRVAKRDKLFSDDDDDDDDDDDGWYGNRSSTSGYGNGYGSSRYGSRPHISAPSIPTRGPVGSGHVGLVNLGNTCFMNSALQCLSHTPALTAYFLSGEYEREINVDNPIGCGGKMAQAYAGLMNALWRSAESAFSPRYFKDVLGRHAPQFIGYQQHDAQELTASLLDGLHEDLNRIIKKPYVEMKEADGKPDDVAAAEAWERHKLRNDSVIVDLFHGQYKSTITCPDCSKISVTFDPMMYLSVPIPDNETRDISVKFVPYNHDKEIPTKMTVSIPKHAGTFMTVCEEVEKIVGVTTANMVVVEMLSNRFYKQCDKYEKPGAYTHETYHVYEIPEVDDSFHIVPLYLGKPKSGYTTAYSYPDYLGRPFLLAVPKDGLTTTQLKRIIALRLQKYYPLPLGKDGSVATSTTTANEANAVHDDNDGNDADDDDDAGDDVNVMQQQSQPAAIPASNTDNDVDVDMDMDSTQDVASDAKDATDSGADDDGEASGPDGESGADDSDDELENMYQANSTKKRKTTLPSDTEDAQVSPALLASPRRKGRDIPNGADQANAVPTPDAAPIVTTAQSNSSNNNSNNDGDVLNDDNAAAAEAVIPGLEQMFYLTGLNGYYKKPIIDNGGVVQQQLDFETPILCYFKSKKSLNFREMKLMRVDPSSSTADGSNGTGVGKRGVTLRDCVDHLTREERLTEDNMWYCPVCKEQKRASKKLEVWKVPQYLIVHLKRFSYNRYWRDKLNTVVNFPLAGFDLNDYVLHPKQQQSSIYDLYAISNHMGGMGGGHYTAYCLDSADQETWMSYDDRYVSEANKSYLVSGSSYLLFYKRRDLPDISALNVPITEYIQDHVDSVREGDHRDDSHSRDTGSDTEGDDEKGDATDTSDATSDSDGDGGNSVQRALRERLGRQHRSGGVTIKRSPDSLMDDSLDDDDL